MLDVQANRNSVRQNLIEAAALPMDRFEDDRGGVVGRWVDHVPLLREVTL